MALAGPARVWVSTFHAFAARWLRRVGSSIGIAEDYTIYDHGDQRRMIRQTLKELSLDLREWPPGLVAEAISRAKADLITPEEFGRSAQGEYQETVARIYGHYQKLLALHSALDFDDLLGRMVQVLRDSEEARSHLHDRFSYLLVDEYQDTNLAQYELARLLAAREQNICVTGDPDQSIYGWRGARLGNILRFPEDYPGCKVVLLGRNYRSTQRILAAASQLVSHNLQRFDRPLFTDHEPGEKLTVIACMDETQEAQIVAERSADLIRLGSAAGQVAVFYRTNAMSRALELGFARAGIPYQVVAGIEFFGRREVKDLLAYLMLALNPNDDLAFVRCLEAPARGLGETGVTRLRELARREGRSLFGAAAEIDRIPRVAAKAKQALAEFRSLIDGLRQKLEGASVAVLLAHIIKSTAYEDYLREHFDDADERLANVGELLDAAAEYDAGPNPDGLRGFLEEATLASDQDALDSRSDTVKLMTLHAAKGLEFDHVFVAGLEEGLLPLVGEAEEGQELEEERRLLYVGITRARRSVTLTFAHFRRQYGVEEARVPSRFLEELPEEHLHTLEFGEEGRRPGRSRALASTEQARRGSEPEGPLPGEWVEHPAFGRGQVLALESGEEGGRATVRFVDGSTRVLVLKYAKLTRLGRKR
jgi:DNA helicase-2/ATP-dependent DNA helicase PcrA